MPAGGGRYGMGGVAGETASTLKRQAARRVSYDNTKLRPRTKPGVGKFAHVKPVPNPARG